VQWFSYREIERERERRGERERDKGRESMPEAKLYGVARYNNNA
jgi:hypothetical protein